MTDELHQTFRTYARPAGAAYLLIILFGVASEAALRAPLVDWTSAEITAEAIAGNLAQFRLSIGFDLLMIVFDVTVAVLFYRMLRPVDATLSTVAMTFRLIEASVIAANLMTLFAVEQTVTTGGDPLPLLALHAAGYDLALVFFGVNCLITAFLLCHSGAIHGLIAGGIGAAGVVYLAGSFTRFLAPEWNAAMQPAYLVPLIAETALCLWLLRGPARKVQLA